MTAVELWASLDDGWRISFEQAWEALRAGSIPVGACVADPDGRVIHASRNRTGELLGPLPNDGYLDWMRAAGAGAPLELALRL